ncbi:related to Rho-type GTPase-activating protein 1 [Zygosaccharomyces bailii ISA1307]|nr:related to Rho-type GTPase-activating protein 1 [Zygosaccharomyces bailii ISA1307]
MDFGTSLTEFTTASPVPPTYPTCVRCRGDITSGHAYELGDDRWHTHCFSCYRCEKPLSCDSDFLVLGTGTLICFDCSDACRSCGKKIDDLAIILSSSNEAYCSECFKCCKCGEKIKDLKYAKTKRGLFCISCHEKLLAKRKYYEEKKRRLKKDLPELPPELTVPPVIPEKSPRRSHSPSKPFYQPSQSMKSTSGSVISQYLDDIDSKSSNDATLGPKDSNKSSTKEEEDSHREASEKTKDIHEDLNRHGRTVSIDDMLSSTLEGSQEIDKEDEISSHAVNGTPLRNRINNESFSKSPVTHRHGMVVDDSEADSEQHDMISKEQETEKERESSSDAEEKEVEEEEEEEEEEESEESRGETGKEEKEEDEFNARPLESRGLALNLPSHSNPEDTLTLGICDEPASPPTVNAPEVQIASSSPIHKPSTSKLSVPKAAAVSPKLASSLTAKAAPSPSTKAALSPQPKATLSPLTKAVASPKAGPNTTTSTQGASSTSLASGVALAGNSTSSGSGNKLGRSLSMKSKHLVQNLKSRTTGILDPKPLTTSPPTSHKSQFFAFPSSSANASSEATTKTDSDTHSGWGVPRDKSSMPRSPSMHRTTPKGKSDSTIQPEPHSPSSNHVRTSSQDNPDHRRSRSHASVSSSTTTNVSMYRTPPLDNNNSVFGRTTNSSSKAHHRNFSWQTANETVKEEDTSGTQEADTTSNSEISENENFLKKEMAEAELALRKLKLELRELDSKKRQLTSEVDSLRLTKEGLCRDIEGLKNEKERFVMESLDQMQQPDNGVQHQDKIQDKSQEKYQERHQQQLHRHHQHHHQQSQQQFVAQPILPAPKSQEAIVDDISPARHTDTASIARPASKPKFWKIFSGGRLATTPAHTPQHQHEASQSTNGSSGSSSTTNAGSNNNSKLEISNPVLQNPHEFNDVKLMPITNSNSENSSRASPSKSDGTMLYGSNLVARCAYEQNAIPMIVTVCTKHIEDNENFMKTEGLYRKSGSQILIEEIEKAFADCYVTPSPDLLKLMDEDIHAVASVLKRYLRKLPNPVLTFQIYEPLIRLVRESKLLTSVPLKNGGNTEKTQQYVDALEAMVKILNNLPKEHYELLRHLSQHIGKVTSFSECNLMNLYNLSLVFAPGLIRDYNGDRDILDMKERNYIVGFLLGNYRDIFDLN